jgi:hypothetical protein
MDDYANIASLVVGVILILGASFHVMVIVIWSMKLKTADLIAPMAPGVNLAFGIAQAIVGAALLFGSVGGPGFQLVKYKGGGPEPETILPSRIFAGPGQYPPRQFKAYGIVAFKTRPTAADRSRYDAICDAYVSGLLHYTSVKAPLQQQMVTVWPVDTPALAEKINREARDKVCADAVPNYGLALAQEAIDAAKKSKAPLDGDGPFLLAWSPGAKQGQADALVLVSDMTDVINSEQAKQIFTRWALDIQENPELWNNGWDQEKLKLVIRLWVDKWGAKILQAINMKS